MEILICYGRRVEYAREGRKNFTCLLWILKCNIGAKEFIGQGEGS